jgi:Skp family chaperone for outer membrane proteins
MKLIRILLLTALCSATFALPCLAQSRVATVDVKRLFDGYWRTKQAAANLKEQAADMAKEGKGFADDYTKARQDYQKLLDSTADTVISAEERDKRKAAAEKKLLEIRELEQTLHQYDRQATSTMQEKNRRMRDNILRDIREVVNSKAKAGGYALVLDTAAEGINNTPVVMYSSGDSDLTDAVLTQLQSTAPTDLPKADTTPTETKPDPKK